MSGEEPSWYERARCRGHQNLFYPKANERPQAREARERQAIAVCTGNGVVDPCPVIDQCLAHARANQFDFIDMVMGGLSYDEWVPSVGRWSRSYSRINKKDAS